MNQKSSWYVHRYAVERKREKLGLYEQKKKKKSSTVKALEYKQVLRNNEKKMVVSIFAHLCGRQSLKYWTDDIYFFKRGVQATTGNIAGMTNSGNILSAKRSRNQWKQTTDQGSKLQGENVLVFFKHWFLHQTW